VAGAAGNDSVPRFRRQLLLKCFDFSSKQISGPPETLRPVPFPSYSSEPDEHWPLAVPRPGSCPGAAAAGGWPVAGPGAGRRGGRLGPRPGAGETREESPLAPRPPQGTTSDGLKKLWGASVIEVGVGSMWHGKHVPPPAQMHVNMCVWDDVVRYRINGSSLIPGVSAPNRAIFAGSKPHRFGGSHWFLLKFKVTHALMGGATHGSSLVLFAAVSFYYLEFNSNFGN
jgi:hypothetical protein